MLNEDKVRSMLVLSERIVDSFDEEFMSLPMYRIYSDGSIKINPGFKKSKDDVIVFDVTNASPELKSKYESSLEQLDVYKGKIVTGPIKQEPVRIFDVLSAQVAKDAPYAHSRLLANLPMYTVVSDGVLKENAGIRRNVEEHIVYDMTNASELARDVFAGDIEEMVVKDVIKVKTFFGKPLKRDIKPAPKGRITTVLSLLGEYQNLTRSDQIALGCDFVRIEDTDEGLKLTTLIRQKELETGDIYLRLDTGKIEPQLLEVLESELVELTQKNNGFYSMSGSEIPMQKEL